MGKKHRICLVSPGHLASNPRLVKEANALQAAGYAVHVVSGWYSPRLDSFDRAIMQDVGWSGTVVPYLRGPRVLWAKVRRNLARKLLASTGRKDLRLALSAHHEGTSFLAAAAQRIPTDVYIGHCLAGLCAAALAARRTGVPYAFDAEDFHSAETDTVLADPALSLAVRTLESEFLPGCAHVTAASPGIGAAYAEAYALPPPTTVLNTFPRSEAPPQPVPPERPGAVPRVYWFSQTIGEGRGLEPLLSGLAQMSTRCDLHLRGAPSPGYIEHLLQHARRAGFPGRIEFLPTAAPADMARLAAGYDLGLSLELPVPRNHDICLGNKIFTYLLAGLPVVLSNTSAQRELAQQLGDAGLLVSLENPGGIARTLDAYFAAPDRQGAARSAAWQLGQTRFNWEYDQQTLLSVVAATCRNV